MKEDKKPLINNDHEVPTIEFGDGCVEIAPGFVDDPEKDFGVMSFKSIKKMKVGDYTGTVFTKENVYYPVVFPGSEFKLLFKNIEGLDVLIEGLIRTRKYMQLTEND